MIFYTNIKLKNETIKINIVKFSQGKGGGLRIEDKSAFLRWGGGFSLPLPILLHPWKCGDKFIILEYILFSLPSRHIRISDRPQGTNKHPHFFMHNSISERIYSNQLFVFKFFILLCLFL